MNDDDSTDRGGDHRDERPFGANRRPRTGGGGFERLLEELAGSAGRFGGPNGRSMFEKIMRDVSSLFDDEGDGRGTRGAGGSRSERPVGDGIHPSGGTGGDVAGRRAGRAHDDGYADEDDGGATSFRGRGPKNYRRSDERIAELVNDALHDDDVLDASDIEVSVADGDITLSGTVSSRRHKHRAENVAVRVAGAHDVDNRVRVKRASAADGTHGAPGGIPGETRRDADDYGHP